ncbi:MAG: peptidylprolyl isomerase [Bacillota bacterium]
MLKNKKMVISAAVILLVVLAIGGYIYYASATSYVGTVAGEKITRNEYSFFLGSVKLQMESDANLTDEASREAFWNSKVEGNDARAVAKQRALDSAKEFKIQLIKAREKKLFLNDKDMKNVEDSIDSLIGEMSAKFQGKPEAEKEFKKIYNISFKQYKEVLKDLMLVYKFVQEEQKGISVTEEDMKAEYDKNSNKFDKVTVRHILFPTKNLQTGEPLSNDEQKKADDKSKETLEKINNGGDIEALAKELSADPTAKDNGGIIEMDYTRGIPEIKDWAMKEKVGTLSVVQSEFGYHVVKLEKRTSYNDVKDKVKNSITSEKYQKILEQWTKESQYNLVENKFALDSVKV